MNRLLRWFLSCGLLLVSVGACKADFVPAFDFSGGTSVQAMSNITIGSAFTVGSQNVNVTAVGVNSQTFSTGPFPFVIVRIYQDGTTTNVLNTTVSNTSALSNNGNYLFTSVTGVTLTANTTYEIVEDVVFSHSFGGMTYVTGASVTPNSASGVTFGNAVGDLSSNNTFPTTDTLGLGPYFGPAFQTTAAVPEPSSLVLGSIAAGGLAVAGWRRRRAAIDAANLPAL
jgi:PEP-CTERM motif-containing protein